MGEKFHFLGMHFATLYSMLPTVQILIGTYLIGSTLFQLDSNHQMLLEGLFWVFSVILILRYCKGLLLPIAMILMLAMGFCHQTPVTFDNKLWLGFIQICLHIRDYLLAFAPKALPEPYATLLNGLIFGTSAAPLAREIQDQYRKAGVIHLLVVSGSQIALLVGTILQITQNMKLPKVVSFIVVTLFNVGFTIATGADPSILRACVMAEITQIQNLWGAPKNSISLLMITAFVLCLLEPGVLWQVSFQLSFAATVGLMFVSPVFKEYFKNKMPQFLGDLLGTTLGPILVTMPFCLFYFSGFSLIALPLNLVLPPLVEMIVLLGFAVTLLSNLFWPIAYIIYQFLLLPIGLIHHTVLITSSWSWIYWNVVSPTAPLLALYSGAMILWIMRMKNHPWFYEFFKKPTWLAAIVVLLLGWHQLLLFANPSANAQLTVTDIDVGQGDAILIQTPEHKNILIDAGPAFGQNDAGRKYVLPFLRKKGINNLDLVIITHPHLDHFGGLPAIIKEINVKKIISSGYPSDNTLYQRLQNLIHIKNIPYEKSYPGEAITVDRQVSINVIMPPQIFLHGAHSDANENSVVILLRYQKFSAMFTGDAGAMAEQTIIATVPTVDLTVLKVGHHGSRYSSSPAFLNKFTPDIALISCGKNNRYKHPHIETVQNLMDRKIQIHRTDLEGDIAVYSDGQDFKFESSGKREFKPR